MKFIKIFIFILLLNFSQNNILGSNEEWVVSDIRISGLQRVSAGSIFNVMPISIGDSVDVYELQMAAKTIFKTGFSESKIGPHSPGLRRAQLAAGQGVALILLQTVAVQKPAVATATLSKCKCSAALQWQRSR